MQLGLALGLARRDAGIARVTINNATWIEHMRVVARHRAARFGSVSADELRAYCSAHDLWPTSSNAWGGIFNRTEWELVERRPSAIKSNNARWIGVYRPRASNE